MHLYEFDIDAVALLPGVGSSGAADFQLADVAQSPHSRQDLHKHAKRAHALHPRVPADTQEPVNLCHPLFDWIRV